MSRDCFPFAEVETSFALVWTQARAVDQHFFAYEVVDRFPALFDALSAGEIDVARVRVIVDGVAGLATEPATGVLEKVLPHAPRQTTGELRARVRRLVLAADPQLASRRAPREVKDRKVRAYLNDNNLAGLAGYELAPHRVAAVMQRLDSIAKTAKAAGDRRRMDQLRADAFLDLLAGDGFAAGGPVSDGAAGAGMQAAGLWAGGVPPPPPWAYASDVVDADQEWMRRFWLAGFAKLPTSRGCPTCQRQPGTGRVPAPRAGVVDVVVPWSLLAGCRSSRGCCRNGGRSSARSASRWSSISRP